MDKDDDGRWRDACTRVLGGTKDKVDYVGGLWGGTVAAAGHDVMDAMRVEMWYKGVPS